MRSQREFSLTVTSQIEKNLCKLDGSNLRLSSAAKNGGKAEEATKGEKLERS